MKKRVAIFSISVIVIIIIAVCCMVWVYNRENGDEPRDVVLELVNPITGEIINNGDTIDLPEEGTPIQVRIKDKESGEYLTDDDLPENTVNGSYKIQFMILDDTGHSHYQDRYEYWPTKEDIDFWWIRDKCNWYEMRISFDCRPEKPKDPQNFVRKYKMKTENVRFYINKPWRDGDDRYNQ